MENGTTWGAPPPQAQTGIFTEPQQAPQTDVFADAAAAEAIAKDAEIAKQNARGKSVGIVEAAIAFDRLKSKNANYFGSGLAEMIQNLEAARNPDGNLSPDEAAQHRLKIALQNILPENEANLATFAVKIPVGTDLKRLSNLLVAEGCVVIVNDYFSQGSQNARSEVARVVNDILQTHTHAHASMAANTPPYQQFFDEARELVMAEEAAAVAAR